MKAIKNEKELKAALEEADLLVNATSVGLKEKDPAPIAAHLLPKKKIFVFDLIYGPRKTKFLRQAKRLGHLVVSGETMLLHQAARALEIWTKRKAPVQVMRKALYDAALG